MGYAGKRQAIAKTLCVLGMVMLFFAVAPAASEVKSGPLVTNGLPEQDHVLFEENGSLPPGVVPTSSDGDVSQAEEEGEATPVATVVPLPTAIVIAGPPPLAPCVPIAILGLVMIIMAIVLVRGAGLIDRRSRRRDHHHG